MRTREPASREPATSMSHPVARARAVSGLLVVASMLVASERDAAGAGGRPPHRALREADESVCGGAAAAMVFRYWGDGQADPNQFAPLLDRAASGIAADVLAQAIEDRWLAGGSLRRCSREPPRSAARSAARHRAARGSARTVSLRGRGRDDGQPHRLALSGTRAVAPVTVQAFVERWQRWGFWALLVLPGRTPS